MADLFIGVDGGATRSRALAVDGSGRELARVEGGPGRVDESTRDAVIGVLDTLVRDAAARAGGAVPVAGLVAGLAGAGREPRRADVEAGLAALGLARRVAVGTDTDVAFHDAFGDGAGILLVAGTGSIALGRSADGGAARAGGWGAPLGDEGSGWWIGLEALRAVARARDGRGRDTGLTDRILDRLGLGAPEDLIAWTAVASKADIAALAKPALEVAGEDAVAAAIADAAAAELAAAARAVRAALEPWPDTATVALTGGLIAPGRGLRDRTEAALARAGLAVDAREVDSARGAAKLALELAGP